MALLSGMLQRVAARLAATDAGPSAEGFGTRGLSLDDPIVEIAKQNPPQLYRAGTMGPEDTILLSKDHLWIDPKDYKE